MIIATYVVSMIIVSILAYNHGWIDGNKLGKKDATDFNPGEKVWYFDDFNNRINEGYIDQIHTMKDQKIWYIDSKNSYNSVSSPSRIFRSYSEAEEFLNIMKGGE